MEMLEYKDWYRVYVDSDAEFFAPGNSEEVAISAVIKYCNNNRFLGLDPEMMLPHGVWGKPLEPIIADNYHEIRNNTDTPFVRLVKYNVSTATKLETEPANNIAVNEDQLCLFTIANSFGFISENPEYSYYCD